MGRVLSYSEKRLVHLLRRAALQHIRREYDAAERSLRAALLLVRAENRAAWEGAEGFLAAWARAVAAERDGEDLEVSAASWVHLGQEIAALLDTRGDWAAYLRSRWRLVARLLPKRSRWVFAGLSVAAFGLSSYIIVWLFEHALAGHWDDLVVGAFTSRGEQLLTLALILARVAGTVLMAEHAILWARKAITGQAEKAKVVFVGALEPKQ